MYLSVHYAKDALCNSFIDKVIAVRGLAHLPVICLEADLFKLTWDIEQCGMPLDNLVARQLACLVAMARWAWHSRAC